MAPYKGKNSISQISQKKNIWKKRGGFCIIYQTLEFILLQQKQEIFLHANIYFLNHKNVFPHKKRNKIMKGQVVVIFIFKKQGKTKRKHSEGKNFMIYLTIDWSRSEPLSLLHYFHLKVQKVSITAERISNRSVALTVLFHEMKTMHKTQKLHIIQRVLHHAQWFPHKSFFFSFWIFL